MEKITEDIKTAIEQRHNVYVDAESGMYNVGGGYDCIYGWMLIPDDWITEATQ